MASSLQKDYNAPNYKFQDDPYLTPYNPKMSHDYILSKQAGKDAARFVVSQNSELFEKNLIEMFPKIKALTPRNRLPKKIATPKYFEELINACNLDDATKVYKHLLAKKKVEPKLDQSYLELLCYYNSGFKRPMDDEEYLTLNINKMKRW